MAGVSTAPAANDGGRSRGRLLERFGSTAGRVIGIAGLVGVGAVLVNLALGGRTLQTALVAAVAVLVGVVCWMVLVRPGVAAYERVLLVRNMASDWEVPWHAIDGAEARQTLRVYTGGDTLHAVGVAKSTRQMLGDSGAIRRRGGFDSTMGGRSPFAPASPMQGSTTATSAQDHVAERVMHYARQQAAASQGSPAARRRWALVELALLAVSIVAVVVLAVAA